MNKYFVIEIQENKLVELGQFLNLSEAKSFAEKSAGGDRICAVYLSDNPKNGKHTEAELISIHRGNFA